jgi:uncharacterized protein with gpF-like domain
MPEHTQEQKDLWVKIERKRLSYERWGINLILSALRESVLQVFEDLRESPEYALSQLDEDVFNQPLRESFSTLYKRVGTEFAQQVHGAFAKADLRDYWIEKMALLAEIRSEVVIVGMNEVTKERIRRAIIAGAEAGEGIDQIARRVRDSYAMNRTRARMIARTEIVSAANQGQLLGAESSAIPLRKEWISTIDDRTRTLEDGQFDHLDMNGTIIDLKEKFNVNNEYMDAPGDWKHGASAGNVINCRCTVAFVPI